MTGTSLIVMIALVDWKPQKDATALAQDGAAN